MGRSLNHILPQPLQDCLTIISIRFFFFFNVHCFQFYGRDSILLDTTLLLSSFPPRKINENKILRSTPEGRYRAFIPEASSAVHSSGQYERNPKEVHLCWGMYACFGFWFCLVLIWRQGSPSWMVLRDGELLYTCLCLPFWRAQEENIKPGD